MADATGYYMPPHPGLKGSAKPHDTSRWTRHHELFSTPERMEDYRKQTPLGRNGTANEVAQAVLFLASDAAAFMTGAIVDINGGRFLR